MDDCYGQGPFLTLHISEYLKKNVNVEGFVWKIKKQDKRRKHYVSPVNFRLPFYFPFGTSKVFLPAMSTIFSHNLHASNHFALTLT